MTPEREALVGNPPRAPGGPDPRYTWDCRAMAEASAVTHNCATAIGPDGKRPCRACWDYPQEEISYREH